MYVRIRELCFSVKYDKSQNVALSSNKSFTETANVVVDLQQRCSQILP